jgi:hypothetical protein
VTTSELAKEVFSIVEAKVLSRPSPAEFEMAYQIRVAIDNIRFAVKQIDRFSSTASPLSEASLQLLDVLDRLEAAERNFQRRWRRSPEHKPTSNGESTSAVPFKDGWSGNGRFKEHLSSTSQGGMNVKTDD